MKNNKKSITENFIYNILYQILVTALPILTTPYTARALGLHANGIHSYTEGIVTYFMLFGTLGTALYGTRKVAYERNNPQKMSKATWEIILLRFFLITITLGLYIGVLCFNNEYALYYRIQIVNILANALDISWFYQGVEDFKKITIRNMLVKMIYVLCLFLFIKEPSDLPLYIFLIVAGSFSGNLLMWIYLKSYLVKSRVGTIKEILQHLKSSVALFIPQITNYVYALLDRSMLKWITDDVNNVGIYDQAQRLVRAITAILQSIGYVMLARIANLSAEQDEQGIRHYIQKTMNFTLFLAMPIMFGLLGTADDFIPIFLGNEYLQVAPVLKLLSVLVFTMSINSVLGIQLLIPVGKESKYAVATSTGAITNVLINVMLIPIIGVYGACVSSIVAECCVFLISYHYAREYVKVKDVFKDNVGVLAASVFMFSVVFLIGKLHITTAFRLMLEVTVGCGIYFGIMLISKNETMMLIFSKVVKGVKNVKWTV